MDCKLIDKHIIAIKTYLKLIIYISGKCYVMPKELIPEDPFVWTQKGTYRFYYEKMYNVSKKEFSKLPSNYKEIHGCSLYNSGTYSRRSCELKLPFILLSVNI